MVKPIFKNFRPDGRVYEGQWKEGKQHGIGKFTDRDGVTTEGIWDNGARVRWMGEQVGQTS